MSDNINNTNPPSEPLTREEEYLSAIAGVTSSDDIPEKPLTRVEKYLNKIVEDGGGSVYDKLEAGTNINIEETSDGKAKISASGEVSSEDTYAREQISAILDGSTIDSFADVETALTDKVDKVEGKGLSANDFTDVLKTKLDGIAAGAEVNVQSDWNQTTDTADDYIKNKPTLGTAAAKNATDTYSATGDDVTTGKAVAAALATLPEPMVFMGSLGTGGTIATLPTASSSNKGYVYKVITAGTYASQSAKVGDTFISDSSAWVLIPSGDEPSGTVTNVAVANGGGLTVSGSPITSSGTITVGHSNSVTAKTSSTLKKFTYDAYGHVTGSSELSTAESDALASGIDSTKVAQIETNKNNISTIQTSLEVGQNDDGKVLTATYSGGTGTYSWVTPSGGGGTSDYTDLTNKPQINGITLNGNKSLANLGIAAAVDIPTLVSGLNTTGTVKNGSSVTSATGYTASPIISGIPYYKDTTYESKSAASGGTAVSLCTTGEKYTWNNKQSALTTAQLNAVNSGIDSTKVAQIETNKDNISSLIDTGAKNVINNTLTNGTVSSQVTATVDSNLKVTLSGTTPSNADASFAISSNKSIPTGTYIGSGCPSGGATDKYRIDYIINDSTVYRDMGNGVEFTVSDGDVIRSQIVVYRGNTAPSAAFAPMVCLKSQYQASSAYIPYSPTNAELYALIKALQS